MDWYTRLEQGRSHAPSAYTLNAISKALNLNHQERSFLLKLAGIEMHHPFEKELVPGPILKLLEALNLPAYVIGKKWDVLAWNHQANEVFGFSALDEDERNILKFMFTTIRAKNIFGSSWETVAKRMVTLFRSTAALAIDEKTLLSFKEALDNSSPVFQQWWDHCDFKQTESRPKVLEHKSKGTLRFMFSGFSILDQPDLRLTILNPDP